MVGRTPCYGADSGRDGGAGLSRRISVRMPQMEYLYGSSAKRRLFWRASFESTAGGLRCAFWFFLRAHHVRGGLPVAGYAGTFYDQWNTDLDGLWCAGAGGTGFVSGMALCGDAERRESMESFAGIVTFSGACGVVSDPDLLCEWTAGTAAREARGRMDHEGGTAKGFRAIRRFVLVGRRRVNFHHTVLYGGHGLNRDLHTITNRRR